MREYKKRFINQEDRVALRKHGLSTLDVSDLAGCDPEVRARGQALGSLGVMVASDLQKVRKRLREWFDRPVKVAPRPRPKSTATLDELLEGCVPDLTVNDDPTKRRRRRAMTRDIELEDEPMFEPDVLELWEAHE